MSLTPRLLKTTTLTITRQNIDGQVDDYGNWTEGTQQAPIQATGSLQPYKQGKSREDLPKGVTASDVYIYYTRTEFLTSDEYTGQEADKVTIKGVPFMCFHVEDWTTHNLKVDNYKVTLVREDKMDAN